MFKLFNSLNRRIMTGNRMRPILPIPRQLTTAPRYRFAVDLDVDLAAEARRETTLKNVFILYEYV